MSSSSVERPLVAIVGRPNVGKSSLFNRLLGERAAIVEATAGVTRDRLIRPIRMDDYQLDFDLMDTGGIGIVDRADLAESVEMQVETGLHAAQVVIFLVDAREGLTLLDEQVARLLRRGGHDVLIFANKAETREAERNLGEFDKLGLGRVRPLSAQEGKGIGELFEELAATLPPAGEVIDEQRLRIAVLGRRNTGKSSYVNALLGEERVIVSDIAGTTRDAIDIDFEWKSRPLTLVDTAGIHRRGKVANAIEYFSLTRSDQAIRRADIALLFLDMSEEFARLDQELARTIVDRYKPCVIVGTKSDLVPEMDIQTFRDKVAHRFPHLRGAPIVMLSNVTGRGVDRALREAFALHEEATRRVGTGELNRAVEAAFQKLRFRGRSTEKPRAFYATQIRVQPPSILLFVNRARLFEKEALRAISRELRKSLGYERVPIRLVIRERERSPSKKSG
ncbi:MAG: ribosome biogenesis GTPase Der [Planctomycetes bacterium]|nr:ribosome biogenesis GTPase Der [Planctomycetota bacterium]